MTAFEIAVKWSRNKLTLPKPPEELMPEAMARLRMDWLPVLASHALRVARLERLHPDPFDRLLIAQALVEGLTLVTADPAFAAYGVKVLPT